MTLSVTHSFLSTVPDGPDNTLVKPSDWNHAHTLTAAASTLLGNPTGATGAVAEITLGTGLSFAGNTLNSNGGVTSVSAADGSLTISPTTGAVTASIAANGVSYGKLAVAAQGVTFTRLAKTANYSVQNSDKGDTIALGGSAFFTLTFNAASGYDSNFSVIALNEDTGRAKWISISGGTSFRLWPGQSVIVYNSNNAWQVLGRSRWKAPSGAITVNCDFANGTDTVGATDGLATGASAFKTVENALSVPFDEWDFTGNGQTQLTVLLAQGTTDTTGVHFSAHAFVGAQGGAAVTVRGAGSGATISTTGVAALAFFCNVQVQISNLTLTTATSGDCLVSGLGAQVYILGTGGPVVFGACAGSHMVASDGARIYPSANYSVSGSATTAHMTSGNNGVIEGGGITVTVTANITMGSAWVLASVLSAISAPNVTFSLGVFSVTGKRYEADNLSLVNSNGGGANYFPGTVAGTTFGGGQYV